MEQNLSKDLRETVGEVKALLTPSIVKCFMSERDAESITMGIELLRVLDRMMNLYCDMFEKRDKLMDKMDKVMDKYLEEE